ncbi:MAG: penicillin-binding protein [Rhizobiales bacterium NRL2]|jgi:penicillin-binding protein 1A|nr:MAG: penicillin-binding protein [Rhizobiales bacterium NRL2]
MRILFRILAWLSVLGVIGLITAAGAGYYVYWHFGRDLPEHDQLASYEPPVATRVYAGDGRLMAEYAREHRLFVPIEAVPPRVIHAFLAAEDAEFYQHPGVDLKAIARAVVQNIRNYGKDRRPVGASTITQQVAKNFLLTNEVSITRKIKEAILALRIEQAYSKDHILELYLNEIYLGQGAYGVASASLTYFDKPLVELTVDEAAFLAALPKAPNNYNPFRHNERARARRDWVIDRMAVENMIDPRTADEARAQPLQATRQREVELVEASWFAEEVRRELKNRYGDSGLYAGGLSVQATVEPALQRIARHALREGLVAYDRRHGYRGPFGRLSETEMADWAGSLAATERPVGAPDHWETAVVLEAGANEARLGLMGGESIVMPLERLQWAREPLSEGKTGPTPSRTSDIFGRGDLVLIGPDTEDPDKPQLRQIPKINGAVVAMDPHTGRVLALVGGFSSERSEFNRATQAARQPGSAFKPFVYAAALESGFTPASIILDAPFVIDQGAGQGKWKPSNYSNRFYGPSTLRLGIEKSRNLMTVRLAQTLGMATVADYAERFEIYDDMPEALSYALGAGETTLLRLTTAYAMLVNGGRQIEPTLIDRVQDRRGATVYSHDALNCGDCGIDNWTDEAEPQLVDRREQVIRRSTAYQMVSLLEGVVKRGTGVRVSAVGKPLAGKTGTTNESRDTWFVGFSPDLALGVFAGFDEPSPLGDGETGSSVAAPIFRDIMDAWLKDKPSTPFRVPPDIRLVRIDARSGTPVSGSGSDVILEAFKTEAEQRAVATVRADTGMEARGEGVLDGIGADGAVQPAADRAPNRADPTPDKLPVKRDKAKDLVDGVY